MKYIHKLSQVLIAILMAIGISSCSEDSTSYQEGQEKYIQKTFESMKGDYVGSLGMPDNSSSTIKFTIDDEANFKISSFPMDPILFCVYGGEYLSVKMSSDAVGFNCPIDSVGFTGGYLAFVTKKDLVTNKIEFAYEKDEMQHQGYALVTVKGLYNASQKMLEVNFIVEELVVDKMDYTSNLCPINHQFLATRQDD